MFRFFALALVIWLAPVAAQAECLLKPDLSKRNGYWRYHVDRQTHRHCWYLSGSKGRAERHRTADSRSGGTQTSAPVPREQASASVPRDKPASARVSRGAPTVSKGSPDFSKDKPQSAGVAASQKAGATQEAEATQEPAPTAAYLVDDAWNVIGLEQAPASMVPMVERLKQASGSAPVALAASAPIIPVQEASLMPLAQQTAPPVPGHGRAVTIAALWLVLTGALMWWMTPRRRAIFQKIVLIGRRKRIPAIEQSREPAVATDLRLLTQAVSAHFEAEDERLRTERRVVMRQRRSG